jgi:pectate lyase
MSQNGCQPSSARIVAPLLAAALVAPGLVQPEMTPRVVTREELVARWSETESYDVGDVIDYRRATWQAQAAAGPGHAPLGIGDGSDEDQRLLLSRREGFGRHVTGGYVRGSDVEVTHVTTGADSGPGSLREAVSGNEPRWIVFDGDYRITLVSSLDIGSNKTIDGRGRNVLIQSPDGANEDNSALRIIDRSNVIVHNIRINECGDYTKQALNDPSDCITIQSAKRVWIDHVDLSQAADKLIGISGGSREITVSWSRFFENVVESNDSEFEQQVFQVGNQYWGQEVEKVSTVTSHHNFFDNTGYRHPVVSYGKVHAYNNYIYSFSLYGMHALQVGQLLAEGNIFENTDAVTRDATKFDSPGDGCDDSGTLCDDRNGFVKAVNNVAMNSRINRNRPSRVFDARSYYRYRVDRPDDALKSLLTGFTGWQPMVWVPLSASARGSYRSARSGSSG